MSENRCVCCGEIIPEGRQCCKKCVQEYMEKQRNVQFKAVATKKDRTKMETSGTIKEMTEWADSIMASGDISEISIRRSS